MIKNIVKSTWVQMVLASISFVLSRIAFLIAMILPWKILAVAAGMSSAYFGSIGLFESYSQKTQVIYLGATVVAFFLLHLVLEVFFDFLVDVGSRVAIEKSKKIGVFNNYRNFAKKIYGWLLTTFSSFVYIFIAIIFLFFIYRSIFLVLFFYCIFSFSLLRFFYLELSVYTKWFSVVFKSWWHIGFVIALVWAINDYWKGVMPSLVVTFLALLIYRQTLIMTTVVLENSYKIYKNRLRAAQVFSDSPNNQYQIKDEIQIDFENLVISIENQEWIRKIAFSFINNFDMGDFYFSCNLVEGGNLAYISLVNEDGKDGLLIKIYNKNREAFSEQESILLKSADEKWPFISYIDELKVEGYTALVFLWPASSSWMSEPDRNQKSEALRVQLLTCQLPERCISFYQHSQVGLLDKVKNINWTHLQSYSGEHAEKVDWNTLPLKLDTLISTIEHMPKQLSLANLAGRMTLATSEGAQLANVTRWGWEPVGAAWPLTALKNLNGALEEAAKQRPELAQVDPEWTKIVARLYEFERRYSNRNYVGAVNVLSNLLKHLQELNASHESI